jgi:hypothetical protein
MRKLGDSRLVRHATLQGAATASDEDQKLAGADDDAAQIERDIVDLLLWADQLSERSLIVLARAADEQWKRGPGSTGRRPRGPEQALGLAFGTAKRPKDR